MMSKEKKKRIIHYILMFKQTVLKLKDTEELYLNLLRELKTLGKMKQLLEDNEHI